MTRSDRVRDLVLRAAALRTSVVARRSAAQVEYRDALATKQYDVVDHQAGRIQAFNEVLDLLDGPGPGAGRTW